MSAPDVDPRPARLHGWGRTLPSVATLVPATDEAHSARAVREATVIARGLGRSYGDAAQNGGGTVLDMTALAHDIRLDGSAGTVTVDAGTSLDRLLRALVPHGWFLPVIPGTAQVTVGGAIASDVHGKNHRHDGTFCRHVVELTLQTTAGERVLRPDDETAPWFWATAGGMGLTGVVTRATLTLRAIETGWMISRTRRSSDLEETLASLAAAAETTRYSVGWLDGLATGSALGRGLVTSGDHAPLAALDPTQRREPLDYDPPARNLPPLPYPPLPRLAVRGYNALRYGRGSDDGRLEPISTFFHPLDAIGGWNRLYGRRGFVQWQVAVPDGAERVLAQALRSLARVDGAGAYLVVLKRFGAADPAPLSFPLPGWTLAVDVPAVHGGRLGATLDRLDEEVASAGGRVYLAKDSRVDAALIPGMYPRLDEWRARRDELDPARHLRSDLSRRLRLLDTCHGGAS